MSLQRYKLTIAYRGTRYHGWQIQTTPPTWKGDAPAVVDVVSAGMNDDPIVAPAGIPTVQETLQRAIASVVGHPVALSGSSRTDAGVHAKGQVAHFDTDQTQIPIEGLRRAVNARLPDDVLIRTIDAVDESFDAVSGTDSKRYQYLIWHAPDRPVFAADLAWHRWQQLNIDAMRSAAAMLVGTHDFASFARPGHRRESTIRTVLSCDVSHRPPRLVIGVEGTGFLWNQVRIMVGTLVEVGLGRYAAEAVQHMLTAKDRKSAGGTAPALGLYLQWIKYRPTADAGSAEHPRQLGHPPPHG